SPPPTAAETSRASRWSALESHHLHAVGWRRALAQNVAQEAGASTAQRASGRPNAAATPGCQTAPSATLPPARSAGSAATAASHPRSASAIAYDSVVLVSAYVAVFGTAAGMLPTQ